MGFLDLTYSKDDVLHQAKLLENTRAVQWHHMDSYMGEEGSTTLCTQPDPSDVRIRVAATYPDRPLHLFGKIICSPQRLVYNSLLIATLLDTLRVSILTYPHTDAGHPH